MIVALARNLLIALWRYAKDGVTGFARAPPRTRNAGLNVLILPRIRSQTSLCDVSNMI
jgi:hypothetical protein